MKRPTAWEHFGPLFAYQHLPEPLRHASKPIHEVARLMADRLPEGPEKTAGLRKLLEAKDCFVRARFTASPTPPPPPQDGGAS